MLEIERSLYVLRKWWWLLVAAALIGGAAGYIATKALAKPTYSASALVSSAPASQSGTSGTGGTAAGSTGGVPLGGGSARGTYLAAFGLLPYSYNLVSTSSLAQDAQKLVPGTSAAELAGRISGKADAAPCIALGGGSCVVVQLTVTWPNSTLAPQIANAVATVFVRREKQLLDRQYAVVHRSLLGQENRLTRLMRAAGGHGAAQSWLQSQYADAFAKLYQQDASAQAAALFGKQSISVANPATGVTTNAPKASLNALLAAGLAVLIALVFAFFATRSYGEASESEEAKPVLAKLAD